MNKKDKLIILFLFTIIVFVLFSCNDFLVPSPKVIKSNEMIMIEGGTFKMGNDDPKAPESEQPVHSVTVDDFLLSKYEVTQREYIDLIGHNPSATKKYREAVLDESGFPILGKYKDPIKGDNLPIENVTWFDAIKYCNAKSKEENLPLAYDEKSGDLLDTQGKITTNIREVKGYRLPTEAEWEFAARGGNKSKGYKYSGSDNPNDVFWYVLGYIQEVGRKKPNELELYDMSGNVWEWCTDWYDKYSSDSIINPYTSEKKSGKVFRGGSFSSRRAYMSVYMRSALEPFEAYDFIGFRIAKTID